MKAQHYLKLGAGPWREVTEQEYVAAERSAGFHPKSSLPQDKPATSSFSKAGVVEGKTRYNLSGIINPVMRPVDVKTDDNGNPL